MLKYFITYFQILGNGSVMEFLRNNSYASNVTYEDFAEMFTADLFDPDKWAEYFHEAGAKYVSFTFFTIHYSVF